MDNTGEESQASCSSSRSGRDGGVVEWWWGGTLGPAVQGPPVQVTVIVIGNSSCRLRSLAWNSNSSVSAPGATLIDRPVALVGCSGEKLPVLEYG